MLALAGAPLDVRFRFLDPAPDACAGQVGELIVGPYDDPELLDRLADGADAVTYEFENVPVEAARRVRAVPDARALELGQDRLVEKELFRRLGIATARFGSLDEIGVPALVKSRRLGYDGKGQRVVGRPSSRSARTSWRRRSSRSSASCRSSRSARRDGETRFYPLAENEHRGGILAVSRAPAARQRHSVRRRRSRRRLLDELGYVGVLAVELFEVEGQLLANEFAPRVHNTGHWTIDGAETSQFENHVRAILGSPARLDRGARRGVMVNLVGGVPALERLLADSRSARPSVRQAAAGGSKARPCHARRCGRGDGRRGRRRSPTPRGGA